MISFPFAVIDLKNVSLLWNDVQPLIMSHNKGRDFLDFDFYCLLNMLLEYEF